MTSITIYDGAETIGGTKIYLEEKGKGLFLDFGMNFKKYSEFFQAKNVLHAGFMILFIWILFLS